MILKATKVDGIYTADPMLDKTATKYQEISYLKVLEQGLKVMDAHRDFTVHGQPPPDRRLQPADGRQPEARDHGRADRNDRQSLMQEQSGRPQQSAGPGRMYGRDRYQSVVCRAEQADGQSARARAPGVRGRAYGTRVGDDPRHRARRSLWISDAAQSSRVTVDPGADDDRGPAVRRVADRNDRESHSQRQPGIESVDGRQGHPDPAPRLDRRTPQGALEADSQGTPKKAATPCARRGATRTTGSRNC